MWCVLRLALRSGRTSPTSHALKDWSYFSCAVGLVLLLSSLTLPPCAAVDLLQKDGVRCLWLMKPVDPLGCSTLLPSEKSMCILLPCYLSIYLFLKTYISWQYHSQVQHVLSFLIIIISFYAIQTPHFMILLFWCSQSYIHFETNSLLNAYYCYNF